MTKATTLDQFANKVMLDEQFQAACQRYAQGNGSSSGIAYASMRAAANVELLDELQAAHRIIRNALQIMTIAQKNQWAIANARDGVDGEGTTRANEREAVIARATGD